MFYITNDGEYGAANEPLPIEAKELASFVEDAEVCLRLNTAVKALEGEQAKLDDVGDLVARMLTNYSVRGATMGDYEQAAVTTFEQIAVSLELELFRTIRITGEVTTEPSETTVTSNTPNEEDTISVDYGSDNGVLLEIPVDDTVEVQLSETWDSLNYYFNTVSSWSSTSGEVVSVEIKVELM